MNTRLFAIIAQELRPEALSAHTTRGLGWEARAETALGGQADSNGGKFRLEHGKGVQFRG